jgi:hypothetical protein
MCCLALLFIFDVQSLVDIAREEAERRRLLEEQGIEAKVIGANAVNPEPDENMSIPARRPDRREDSSVRSDSSKGRSSVLKYRTALQKLDREIQQTEERIKSKQARLESDRWKLPKIGRISGRSRTKDSSSQLKAEIEELRTKLKRLQKERFEVYESGKKAGFLPGELDGKYYVP